MDFAIFGILGLMSLFAVACAIERIMFYKKYKIAEYDDINHLENALTKNLTALSVIGSNAPYVGLLGTVMGVMVTFYDMGSGGGIDTDAILVGLSLALKATAAGLLVAIPTLAIYSACMRSTDVGLARWRAANNAS
jgi:biopolymer transport protein ExbB